jgi:hypothetical protein
MPGQRHVAMDTAPDLFLAEVTRFFASERTDASRQCE